jgi:hypothetical protein
MGRIKYGHARTGTDDQTTALQLAALRRARCFHVYDDKRFIRGQRKAAAFARCSSM